MLPNYRDYKISSVLSHSAKGSTWEKHKYIKVANGLYFYPDEYVGGRHLPSSKKKNKSNKNDKKNSKSKNEKEKKGKGGSGKESDKKGSGDVKGSLSEKEAQKYAAEVIQGKYGNGQDRMNKLGKNYNQVQYYVNKQLIGEARAKEIYNRATGGNKSTASSTKKKETSKKPTKKTTTKRTTTTKKKAVKKT